MTDKLFENTMNEMIDRWENTPLEDYHLLIEMNELTPTDDPDIFTYDASNHYTFPTNKYATTMFEDFERISDDNKIITWRKI